MHTHESWNVCPQLWQFINEKNYCAGTENLSWNQSASQALGGCRDGFISLKGEGAQIWFSACWPQTGLLKSIFRSRGDPKPDKSESLCWIWTGICVLSPIQIEILPNWFDETITTFIICGIRLIHWHELQSMVSYDSLCQWGLSISSTVRLYA